MEKKLVFGVGAAVIVAVAAIVLLVLAGDQVVFQEAEVKLLVQEALATYDSNGTAAFDMITESSKSLDSDLYVFVLDPENATVIAHGANQDRVGDISKVLTEGDRPAKEIISDLEGSDGTWVEYEFVNPTTGNKQLKRSWLSMRDRYIFGSGYYLGS